MSVGSDLLQAHIETLVADHARRADCRRLVWELFYARPRPPARPRRRAEVVRHANWFLRPSRTSAFIDPEVYAFADDPGGAAAQVRGEGLVRQTGRVYRQEYVVFLRSAGAKIAYMREYFDPTRAAKALDTPILDLEPW